MAYGRTLCHLVAPVAGKKKFFNLVIIRSMNAFIYASPIFFYRK
jgi:hypothetical protein